MPSSPPSAAARPILSRLAAGLEGGLDLAALLFLPVLALVSRGLAALAAIAGVLALALVLCSRPGALRTPAAPAVLFALLVLWGAISAAWSPDPALSLIMAARLAGLFAAGLALVACVPVIAAPERLLRCFFAGLALGLAILWVQRATGGVLTRPFFVRGFVAPQLNQASDTLAILALPASAMLWHEHRRGAALLLLSAAAAIYTLVGTSAQASFVAGLAAAFLFYYRRGLFAPIAAVLSVLVIVTAPLTFGKLAQIGPFVHLADDFKSSVPHRLLIWSFVGDRIAEKPFRGWGLDASRTIPGGTEWIRPGQPWLPLHPHDAPLQLWLELGVPGIVLGALIIARLWRALGTARWPPLYAAACAGGLAAALAEALGTYGIWQEWWVGTLWFSLFLTLVMARSGKAVV
ncbi:MAG TPA: O-antigen ligase family protein [Stellaceae bacterium]|nr:O-antigen ligase family protein [Stellaceae bacterium]